MTAQSAGRGRRIETQAAFPHVDRAPARAVSAWSSIRALPGISLAPGESPQHLHRHTLTKPSHALANVRRRLLLRIAAVGIAFAALASAAQYTLETWQLNAVVHAMALSEARYLAGELNRPSLATTAPPPAMKEFVYAQLSSSTGRPLIATRRSDSVATAVSARWKHLLAAQGRGMRHDSFSISGRRFVYLSFGLDRARLRFSGLYEVERSVSKSLSRGLALSALGVFLAVAAATAALIPAILVLERLVTDFARNASRANIDTLLTLGNAIAQRDSDTDAHNYRVTLYAIRLGEALGVDRSCMRSIILGAFLHDVGKIGVADAILLKPGPLTRDEFRAMQTHVTRGLEIVGRSASLAPAIVVIAAHHERYDGAGYPLGKVGPEIPLAARIFAVVDVFDALTSKRPYKPAFSVERACEIMREQRGGQFDPEILDRFLSVASALYERCGGADEALARRLLEREVTQRLGVDA